MSEWKAEFRRTFIDAIVTLGSKLNDGDNYYGGWRADDTSDVRSYIQRHGIDYAATGWVDSEWSLFVDTEADWDNTRYGIDADIVCCNGEQFKWRYGGSVGDILKEVLK